MVFVAIVLYCRIINYKYERKRFTYFGLHGINLRIIFKKITLKTENKWLESIKLNITQLKKYMKNNTNKKQINFYKHFKILKFNR